MKKGMKTIVTIVSVLLVAAVWATTAQAATNQATDAGSSVSLSNSGLVTVNAATMQLVKQVWNAAGTACYASSPADAACNSSATTVTVPSGTQLKFLIYVKNTSDIDITDVRFQDLLDDTAGAAGGFTYAAGSIYRTQTGAGEPDDTLTAAQIRANAEGGANLSDAVANTDVAGIDTTASPDSLTVGGAGGAGQNATLSVSAHKSFGIVFNATKN